MFRHLFSVCTLGLEVVKHFTGNGENERNKHHRGPHQPPNKTYHFPKAHQGAVLVIGGCAAYYYSTHGLLVSRSLNDRTLLCRRITIALVCGQRSCN